MTVQGTGFDAFTSTANSLDFKWDNGTGHVNGGPFGNAGATLGTSMTMLVLSFTHLAPAESSVLESRLIVAGAICFPTVCVSVIYGALPHPPFLVTGTLV